MKNALMIAAALFAVCLLSNVAQAESKKCQVFGFMQPGRSVEILNKDLELSCDGNSRCSVFHADAKVQVKYSFGVHGSYLELTDKVTGQSAKSFIDGKNSDNLHPTIQMDNSNGGLVGNKAIKTLTFGCEVKQTEVNPELKM